MRKDAKAAATRNGNGISMQRIGRIYIHTHSNFALALYLLLRNVKQHQQATENGYGTHTAKIIMIRTLVGKMLGDWATDSFM